MTHNVTTDPFEMGYTEEQILEVSQIFIRYCMALKAVTMTPGYTKNHSLPGRYDPYYRNWEDMVGEERLLKLQSADEPLDMSKCNNLLGVRNDDLLDSYASQIGEIVGKPYGSARESGMFMYPPKGFMSWHTNASAPCDRLYLAYSDNGDSFFRYYDNETKEIVTDYDRAGLNWRRFSVTNEPPHFWHCVGSNCTRISLGFRLDEEDIDWVDTSQHIPLE